VVEIGGKRCATVDTEGKGGVGTARFVIIKKLKKKGKGG